VTGTGTVGVGSGATVEADNTVGAGQTFVYTASSTGEFALDDVDLGGSSVFSGAISGFAAGDSLEVGGFGTGTMFTYKSTGTNTGQLQLTDNTLKANIDFTGAPYSTSSFTPNIGTTSTTFTFA